MMKLETNHGEARFQEGSVSMPRARWMKRELDPRALQEENKRERLTPSKPIMETRQLCPAAPGGQRPSPAAEALSVSVSRTDVRRCRAGCRGSS